VKFKKLGFSAPLTIFVAIIKHVYYSIVLLGKMRSKKKELSNKSNGWTMGIWAIISKNGLNF